LPGEQFCCSLGVDPSVKIEYKPARRTNEKVSIHSYFKLIAFQIGFVSKSSLTTHEQVICFRNAKVGEKVQLTVREAVPKPVDEKIKVTIISPDLRSGRTEACLTKDHHVEWLCQLEAGEQREIAIKWTMEFPLNESVVYGTSISGGYQQQASNYFRQQYYSGSSQRVY
jgi:hypothetical protein